MANIDISILSNAQIAKLLRTSNEQYVVYRHNMKKINAKNNSGDYFSISEKASATLIIYTEALNEAVKRKMITRH